MPSRSNYWSCSKFADWLRGTAKPAAETSRGWKIWKNTAKQSHPLRYWFAKEEGLDSLQDILNWPFDKLSDAVYYINNRWVSRSHALTAHPNDIRPGTWCDVGNRFLVCMFNELVDFVEIEQAWHHCVWDEQARKRYSTPWWRAGFPRFRKWRSPAAGLAGLIRSANLYDDGELTYQAIAAKEIIDLYVWWKYIRPNRPDPHDASGWSEICRKRREKYDDEFMWGNDDPEEQRESSQALARTHEIEDQYQQEDEEMMIRLIKVRNSLWT